MSLSASSVAASGERAVGSIVKVKPRFLRSVHLERDIKDPRSSLGYIPTPVAIQALKRISAGFDRNSTQRSWRLTGDYGTGKTDLALALARVASKRVKEVPPELRSLVRKRPFDSKLATGDAEPIGNTILRAFGRSPKNNKATSDEVLSVVRSSVQKAIASGANGVLLIIDELGKNLEYAARNPDGDDLFLLQKLADEASHSGDAPFIFVVLLHQGISAYSEGLESTSRREWAKVAGRFEEIVFAQPLETAATLVGASLGVNIEKFRTLLPSSFAESELAMQRAREIGLFGVSAVHNVKGLGASLFPLHPTTLPVLISIVRRYGQNERSLFSFLSSSEPMGLQDFADSGAIEHDHYRIHNLFDYIRRNMVYSILGSTSSTNWGVIESAVSSTPVLNSTEEDILKTIGVLNLLDDPNLAATQELVVLSVANQTAHSKAKVISAIQALTSRSILFERGASRGLCLWPHTSINLEEAFAKGKQIASSYNSVDALCREALPDPLVPRRYYVETGTLRHAEVALYPGSNAEEALKREPSLDRNCADLELRILVPQDASQYRVIARQVEENASKIPAGVSIGLIEPLINAFPALSDLIAWKWVKENTPALSSDRFAREEVSKQLAAAERRINDRIGSLKNLASGGGRPMRCFSANRTVTVTPGRELLTFLHEELTDLFPLTPRVHNELLNRRNPSKAAVAARTKLAEAMTSSSEKRYLGLDDTQRQAEFALYLSILLKGRFHVEEGSNWVFRLPQKEDDTCNLLPAFERITNVLKGAGTDALVPVPTIFDALAFRPYGIREGLLPVILMIYLATHHQRVALYEDNTYLQNVGGDEIHRLMKEPKAFHLQYCGIEGVRADVFPKILTYLKLSPRDASNSDLIDLIRPLTSFIAREVPEYARRTGNLTTRTIAVRRALLEAREPIKLVFTSLPQACGLAAISSNEDHSATEAMAQELSERLKTSLHEIRAVYPQLLRRLADSVYAAFDWSGDPHGAREGIRRRAARLATNVTEPAIKAFSLRLADQQLDERAWLESLGNLLAKKSPERWTDLDETEFYHQLGLYSARFRRVEAATQSMDHSLDGDTYRVAFTQANGREVCDLVRWSESVTEQASELEAKVEALIEQHGRAGMVAAMRALWKSIAKSESKDGANG